MSYTGTAAQAAIGAAININTSSTSTPTWTLVGEIKEATWSNRVIKTADATNLESTFEEFIATLPNPGTVEFTCNRIPGLTDGGQSAVDASYRAATTKSYQIVLPKGGAQTTTGDAYVFKAIVEECSPVATISPEKIVDFKVRLKLSGSDTFTAGS